MGQVLYPKNKFNFSIKFVYIHFGLAKYLR